MLFQVLSGIKKSGRYKVEEWDAFGKPASWCIDNLC